MSAVKASFPAQQHLETLQPPQGYKLPFNKTAFLPDVKPRTEETTIYDTGPVCPIPPKWQRDCFLVDEVPVYYYIARAKEERGVLVGHSGLKANRPIEISEMKQLNNNGISVIMMETPNMGRTRGFMPFLKKVHARFTLDPKSPAHTLFHPTLPKFLYDHSTSGQFEINLLTSKKHISKIQELYTKSFCEAPFLDSANASSHSSWLPRTVFNVYACLNRDNLPRETLGGLYYLNYNHYKDKLNAALPEAHLIKKLSLHAGFALNMGVKTIKNLYLPKKTNEEQPCYMRENEFRMPTYGQILENCHQGKKVVEKVTRRNTETAIPLHIIFSQDDPFSCPKTIKNLPKSLKAHFIEVPNGKHNPIQKVMPSVIDTMNPYLLPKPLRQEEQDENQKKHLRKDGALKR